MLTGPVSVSTRKGKNMSVVNMAKNIKEVHPKFLICYKTGTFYNTYGKDAYIMSYLFEYKIKEIEKNISVAGFPKNAISKVMSKLEREKINYIIIDTRNNYDIDFKEDYGNLNKYDELFEQSRKFVNIRKRVNKISEILLREADIEQIRKIEKIIYESRKI